MVLRIENSRNGLFCAGRVSVGPEDAGMHFRKKDINPSFSRSPLKIEGVIDDFKRQAVMLVVKADPDVPEVLPEEDVRTFFSRMQNDMPLLITEFLAEVVPFPEDEIRIGFTFPDCDLAGVAEIDNEFGCRDERHLLADPDADQFAVEGKEDRVFYDMPPDVLSDGLDETSHGFPFFVGRNVIRDRTQARAGRREEAGTAWNICRRTAKSPAPRLLPGQRCS